MSEAILGGIKVVELATFIAGPATGVILADFGADVIKIEPPLRPDPYRGGHLRGSDTPKSEYPYGYIVDNRNKKGIALDIKTAEGREAFDRLIEAADVFITNMPIPTRERLNISYEDIRAINPKIIYASISAYGETGPEAGRPGFDTTALWARTGLMDLVKPDPESPPARSLPGMGDHPTAMSLYAAVMTGLFRRERTGKGSHVSTSLMANGVWWNGVLTQAALCGAQVTCRPAREAAGNPVHNLYKTRDGRWIHIVFNTNLHRWPELAKLLGRPEIGNDPRFNSAEARIENSLELIPILDAAFAERDNDEWVQLLEEGRFAFGDVRKVDQILTDTQMIEGRALRPIDDPAAGASHIVDSPIWIEGTVKSKPTMPPELGQDTEAVLRGIGYDDAALDKMRAAGAIP
ncbi:MAG: CoA transferase [Alphaproteobacteria bacterium]|nr:CoA transferase [Alphaproteobacteria bacterium]